MYGADVKQMRNAEFERCFFFCLRNEQIQRDMALWIFIEYNVFDNAVNFLVIYKQWYNICHNNIYLYI